MIPYPSSATLLVSPYGISSEWETAYGYARSLGCGYSRQRKSASDRLRRNSLELIGTQRIHKGRRFLVPDEKEYRRLIRFLKQAGYRQRASYSWKREGELIIFDLYPGKNIYTTEFLTSPLKRLGNQKIREWKRIYLGTLNPTDLIISKMFRGTEVDIEDSLVLLQKEKVGIKKLEKRYRETTKYDVSENRVLRNLEVLLDRFKKEKET